VSFGRSWPRQILHVAVGNSLTVTGHLMHLKMTILTRASLVDPINIECDSRIGRKLTCLCGCCVASKRRSNGGASVARSMSEEVDDCFRRGKVKMRKEQE
jgi:hypothetical protein